MLRLEVAKQLAKGEPRFVTVNPGQAGGLELSKTDINQLLQQLGIAEGLVGQGASSQTGGRKSESPATPQPTPNMP
jgi:hypothetical protein